MKLRKTGKETYLEFAAQLRELLENRPGFISIERFQSMVEEGKVLSLSFWEEETSIDAWRNEMEHRAAQKSGKKSLFETYQIRVAKVVRDYTHIRRDNAPEDSRTSLG
ncbi:MAG: antibiotic biosynthesis monooxygenase [Desulfobacter sp.]|nr:antibiotic biosynthesis monooxygenase [Desulfobacter sp.]